MPCLPERTSLAKNGGFQLPSSSYQTAACASKVRVWPNVLLFLFWPSVSVKLKTCASLSRKLLESSLDMKNYSRRFHLLLHLEEIQMEVDIRNYDMHNQTMAKDQGNKKLLTLKVKTCELGTSFAFFVSRSIQF